MRNLYLPILFAAIGSLASMAQIKIVPESFNLISNTLTTSESDMGGRNMVDKNIEWPLDADGNEEVALLVVSFENVPYAEIENIRPSLSSGQIVVQKDVKTESSGEKRLWIFLPARKNMDVTFTHPSYGSDRLSNKTFESHRIYTLKIRSNKTVSISIDTNPKHQIVVFDNQTLSDQRTPATIPNVTLGKHSIRFISTNPAMCNNTESQSIEVTEANTAFSFDIRKEKEVCFTSDPSGAQIFIGDATLPLPNNKTILKYGEYSYRAQLGELVFNGLFKVDDNFDSKIPVNSVLRKKKTIGLYARQYNERQSGATVYVDGAKIGVTPIAHDFPYGKHSVQMAYAGQTSKTKTLNVNDGTSNEFEIKFKSRGNRTWNPFDIDYSKRAWGFSFNYIQRKFNIKALDGHSVKRNLWGENGSEKGMQIGLSYQPYFGYGQGLNTGLYWQAFWFGDPSESDVHYVDHQLFMPIQYQFRLPLGEQFSIFVNGGIGLYYGVSLKAQYGEGDSEELDYGEETGYPDAFSWSLLFGGGIQFKCLQLEAKYSKGMTKTDWLFNDNGTPVDCTMDQLSVGISFMF